MKKILLTIILIVLSGCSFSDSKETKNPNYSAEKVSHNQYIQEQVNILQKQVKSGEITEKEAREKLKQTLQENIKLNDGSVESILKKLSLTDPVAAKDFEEKIRKNHPEEFTE